MPSPSDPVAFVVFGISIRWYALFILLGIVVCLTVATQIAKRRGLDHEFLLDVAPWVVLISIVGARVYYVLLRWDEFMADPGTIINVRLGGLTVHGALVAGVASFWFFCRRRGQPFLTWIDIVMAGVPFAQAIGRWGNWANQEAFGTPSTLPWAVEIDPWNRPPEYPDAPTFHPTFLYESLLNLAIAAVLVTMALRAGRSTWLRPGDVLWTYLMLYGVARLLVESLRTDSLYIGPLPAAYWLSGTLILVGAAMMILSHRRPRPAPEATDTGTD